LKKHTCCMKLIGIILLGFSLWGCASSSKEHQGLKGSGIWPLAEGNYWLYAGTFNLAPFTMRMGVCEVLTRGDLQLAMLKGHPSDPLQGDEWEPMNYAVLQTGEGLFFQVQGLRLDTFLARFADLNDPLLALVEEEELVLTWPLDTGSGFGSAAQLTREDGLFYWKVTETGKFDPLTIKGGEVSERLSLYSIRYATLADETRIDWVSGIGMVRYRYRHHGTPAGVDLKLVEVGNAGLRSAAGSGIH
jgi:hypothetical protein